MKPSQINIQFTLVSFSMSINIIVYEAWQIHNSRLLQKCYVYSISKLFSKNVYLVFPSVFCTHTSLFAFTLCI